MELSFRIKKSCEIIYEHLSDMQKFVSVHPVIYQIDKIGEDSYLVHEKLKIGFIPISFTYPANVEKNAINHKISINATVFKFTKIEMRFVLNREADYTCIEEIILFKSPFPIKYLLKRIFRKQHTQLFKNIALK